MTPSPLVTGLVTGLVVAPRHGFSEETVAEVQTV